MISSPDLFLPLVVVALVIAVSGCSSQQLPEAAFGIQTYDLGDMAEPVALPQCVNTKYGCLELESVYIAGVVDCELGRLSDAGAALEAQAIAARTYLARYLSRVGPDATVRTNATFQCWKKVTKARSVQAALATDGVVMMIDDDTVINANYVSGTPRLKVDCTPKSPAESGYADYKTWGAVLDGYLADKKARRKRRFSGIAWTEVVVTRNEGRIGDAVQPTPMASKGPPNRGALSQYTAVCLAERMGYETMDILKYFYGDDVRLSRRLADPLETP